VVGLCGGCGLRLPGDQTLLVYVESETQPDRRLADVTRQETQTTTEDLR
jgi:hypothetical protein